MKKQRWLAAFLALLLLLMPVSVLADDYVPSPEQNTDSEITTDDDKKPDNGEENQENQNGEGDKDKPLSPQTGEVFPVLWVCLAGLFGVLAVNFTCLGIRENKKIKESEDDITKK